LFTVGHGERSGAELIELLRRAGVMLTVDVRAYPASRRHPQFGRDALAGALAATGIGYRWEGRALGGLRAPSPASPHAALPVGLRGFADHMATAEFSAALMRLVEAAAAQPLAVLCAERDPAQCHRSLIADALVAAGRTVTHLLAPGVSVAHRLNPRARRVDGALVYDRVPGGQQALDLRE
jgi:uncharacterized protein (DUF488 family)